MVSLEVLNSHTLTSLKKHISNSNIKGYSMLIRGYSKLNKKDVIAFILKKKKKFAHITTHIKSKKKKPAIIKEKPKKTTTTNKFYYKKETIPQKPAPKKKPSDANCNSAKNQAQSIISLYTRDKGVVKSSDFTSRKDISYTIDFLNRWRIDDRCSDIEQDIISKALQLHYKFVENERKMGQERRRKTKKQL